MKRITLALLLAVLVVSSASTGSRMTLTSPLAADITQTATFSGSTFGGVDVVHVWAFPTGQNPIFIGQGVANQPDPVTMLASGSFTVQATNLPVGSYPIVVYAHNATSGLFDTQIVRTYNVRACNWVSTCFTFMTPSGSEENWYINQCL